MSKSAPLFSPILIGGGLILMVGFAIRASFGVFQIPIAQDFNWPRAEFSLAIAIQNLAWASASRFLRQLPNALGIARPSCWAR